MFSSFPKHNLTPSLSSFHALHLSLSSISHTPLLKDEAFKVRNFVDFLYLIKTQSRYVYLYNHEVCKLFYFFSHWRKRMHSSGSFGGGGSGYLCYDIDVKCPSCKQNAEIRLSRSRQNPGRLFYKCSGCGRFIR